MKTIVLFPLFMVLFLSSCIFEKASVGGSEGWKYLPSQVHDQAQSFFEDGEFDTLKIEIADSLWSYIQANIREEEYVRAGVVYRGQRYPDIGLRTKGSWNNNWGCADPSGELDTSRCPKTSLKIKFNYMDSAQEFFGMHKLNLHSLAKDTTKMRDVIAYEMYRNAGIHAPRTKWIHVLVNQKHMGFYLAVEAVDGPFVKSRFRQGTGAVYKEVWPKWTEGTSYAKSIESHPEAADTAEWVQFAKDLRDSSANIAEWIDLREMARYLAVDEITRNNDGVTGWYCGDQCAPHNYYWYRDAFVGFHLIPWDMDGTYLERNFWRGYPRWDDLGFNCDSMAVNAVGARLRSASCDPLFHRLASDKELVNSQRRWVLDHLGNIEQFNAKIEALKSKLAPHVQSDPTLNANIKSTWELQANSLKEINADIRQDLLQRLDQGARATSSKNE